jgi:serine phosphatase RsbU (regulator of sigma subunit)
MSGKMAEFRKILLTVLACLLTLFAGAQNGAPLLSHYKENFEIENQNWAICQDEYNVMLFANRRGILTFDGQSWDYFNIPVIPYSMAYNPGDRKVYIGAEDNYGYLKRDDRGIYSYHSLLKDSATVGFISRIIFTDSTVYFYGEQSISRHNLLTGDLELRLFQKDQKPFTGMFHTERNIFINVATKGLFRLDSDTLFPIVTGYMLQNTEVLFCLPYNEKLVLLGLSDGTLSLFDGIKYYTYPIKDEGYLKQNILSGGLVVSDSLYAFSTLEGGALVISKRTGAIRKTINYLRGLPDDEVFAMGTDNNNGLWLSHQYGLTRAELMLPVGNFTMYKGLLGNLISSLWYNNQLYVATSEGVFYLDQVNKMVTEEVIVKKEPVVNRPIEILPSEIPADQLKKPLGQEEQKTRKNVFARIFGKKATVQQPQAKDTAFNETQNQVTPVKTEQAPSDTEPSPQYIRKTVSRLKSVSYEFKKVEGLDDKCKQLVGTKNGILASTNKGLYIISSYKARSLVKDKYIYFISTISPDDRYYIGTSDGYFYVNGTGSAWTTGYPDKNFNRAVYSIVASDARTLWAGSDDEVIKISLGENPEYRYYKIHGTYPLRYLTSFDNDTVFIFSVSGIKYYDKTTDSLKIYAQTFRDGGARLEYVLSQPESPWIKQDDEWICLGSKVKISQTDADILKIFENINSIVTDENSMWVITGDNQIYRVTLNSFSTAKYNLDLFLKSIKNDREVKFRLSDIVIGPGDNFVYFNIVAPGYLKENSIQYQWIIENLTNNWSPWQTSSLIQMPFKYGTFTVKVRARDIWGNVSEIKSFTYTRKAPFTKTNLFYFLVIVVTLLLLISIVLFRERQLKKEKRILEEKVKERTAEIEAQKEEITSSIEYASRIQLAMLPVDESFSNFFPDHFIIFKPRDIVSGDFYWIGEDDNHIFFTVADCTGHGVPGAFMSTLGISALNEIITNKKDLHANKVLNHLREKIKNSLHQTGKEGEAADGMDVSFCVLHKDRKILEYSGAYNPLLIVHNGELKEYKADRMPIGIFIGEKDSFTNYEISVSRGDTVYLFSDGITDQFGGTDGSKFKKYSLKKLLSGIYELPLAEQKTIIENEFNKWKGNGDQIDDVTIIGLRI